jgi:hypothetical protein
MAIKVGINGFGRIGRNVLRSAVLNFGDDIEIVAINDLLEPDYLAYMLKYDSVHGRFKADVSVQGNDLLVNGKKIRLTQERDPANLKWDEVGADMVLEATGLFLTKETAQKHIDAGAKKVIMSAPSKDDTPMFVWRERQDLRRPGDHLQRLVHHQLPGPAGQGLNDKWGIKRGLMTTVHAATATRRPSTARPTRTGAAAVASWKTSSLVHRCGQGRRRGHPGTEQEADRHELPRADLGRVGGRPDRRTGKGSHLRRDLRRSEGTERRPAEGHPGLHRRQGGGHRLPRRNLHLGVRRRPASPWTAPSSSW